MPTQAPKHPYGARADAPAPDADESSDAVKLTQMRDRLANLSDEARSIRSQVPSEFEPDVERIQQQMHRLGERLSELSAGALYHGGGEMPDQASQEAGPGETVSDEAILLGGSGRADDPWDTVTANALTKFYESGDGGIGSADTAVGGRAGASADTRPVVTVEPAWLDRRFAEIAERIEQSLAEIHPESSLLTIGRRFDQLEMRMASALRGVAMRTDLEELRIAEAQIEDIGAQLDQLRRQLGRLDTIDAHLTTLTEQLSDERLAKLFEHGERLESDKGRWEAIDSQLAAISSQLSRDKLGEIVKDSVGRNADLEGLADTAAQKAAALFADKGLLEAHARDLGEVRGLIEGLINERRSSDENNASMLETMQQAIVRVLDRIDALEESRQAAGAAPAAPEYTPTPVSEAAADAPIPEAAVSERKPAPVQAEAYSPPQAPVPLADRDEDSFLPDEPAGDFQTAPFDLDTAFRDERGSAKRQAELAETPARRMNVLRHDFIADAHRAKLKAASKIDGMGDLGQARMSESGTSVEDAKPAPAARRPRQSFLKSPRVLMSILTLLAMIPAAVFFMPRTRDDADNAPKAVNVSPTADGSSSATGSSAQGNAMPGGPTSPAVPLLNDTGAPVDDSSRQSQQLPPDTPDKANRYQDVGVSPGHGANDRVETAALPDGITMEPDAEPAAGRLVTRHKDGRTSVVSGGPGVSATPATLMQERVLRANGVDTGSIEGQVDDDKALPPAMVGPFSLRLAAAQGTPSAQYEVGSRLAEGKGPDQNLKEAAKWFLRSATNGFAMAQFRLGTLYERGVGVKTDIPRARVWYSRAAEQGNVKAMHNLAVLLAGRSGAEPDYTNAVRWFTEAAERGLGDSQFNLAVLYENGLGVTKDEAEAYKWLLLAAQSGDQEATIRRDALKARLSKEDQARAEAVVAAWRARAIDPEANDSGIAGQAWQRRGNAPSNG